MEVVLAQQKGYDQVLWTDALEHKYVEEVGMMNVMFVRLKHHLLHVCHNLFILALPHLIHHMDGWSHVLSTYFGEDITSKIEVDSNVNTNECGTYTVKYTLTNEVKEALNETI